MSRGMFGFLVANLAQQVAVQAEKQERREKRTAKATATLRKLQGEQQKVYRKKIMRHLKHHLGTYRTIAEACDLPKESTRLALIALEADELARREREGNSDWWRTA